MTDLENREAFEREYSERFPHDKSTLLKSGNYSGWVKQASWEMWQASTQREGFKLMPTEPKMIRLFRMAKAAQHKISINECRVIYKLVTEAV